MREIDLNFDIKESYYSISKQNVFKRYAFSTRSICPIKIIHVIEGEILDVIVGLKKMTVLMIQLFILKNYPRKINIQCLFLGIMLTDMLALSEYSIVSYLSSSKFNQNSEVVLNYNSFGYKWPNLENLIISEKDKNGINYKDI